MPKAAGDVVDAVRARANSTAAYLKRIESIRSSGLITVWDTEHAYRGAFLSFYSFMENTIEYLFLGMIKGRVVHRLNGVRPLIEVQSDAVLTKVVFDGRKYADWLPYTRHTLERSKVYFAQGKPFTLLTKPDRKVLDDVTLLRNALAHESAQAIRLFHKAFTDGKALPPDQLRPAGYLRGSHAIGQTRFEFLTAQAATTLERLT